MILPTKTSAGPEPVVKKKLSENNVQFALQDSVIPVSLDTIGVKIPTVKILLKETFDSPVEELYSIFITKELPSQRIVMKWRCRNWPHEHYATVALNFKDQATQTELQLECKGVPVCHEDSTRQCWQKQHFEEIRVLLQQPKVNTE
uniref:Activator of Hsp90 ATPase homologue 1/2-like C-terminal domain-containing protein n=1 Tax=Chelonoidis abingdonii TaxID=106734 RepID=A0A8C0H336_CHEAB